MKKFFLFTLLLFSLFSCSNNANYDNERVVRGEISQMKGGCYPIEKCEEKNGEKFSIENFKKWCDKNDFKACFNLGQAYRRGEAGAELNNKIANQFYKKACEGKIGNACHQLANAYYEGRDLKIDIKKATFYYEKACDNDANFASCLNVAKEYISGKYVNKDLDKAYKYAKLACERVKNSEYAREAENICRQAELLAK